MTRVRAPMFEDDLDVSDFAPKATREQAVADLEQVRAVSAEASFRSREPAPAVVPDPAPPRREPRRYRTGRNVQLNLKVKQETADLFYALADQKEWVLGETFEHAVEALRRQLSGG